VHWLRGSSALKKWEETERPHPVHPRWNRSSREMRFGGQRKAGGRQMAGKESTEENRLLDTHRRGFNG
jgi:hypothetical protein